jgi:hypothetical protein
LSRLAILLVVVGGIAFLGLLTYLSLHGRQHRVEVCMQFQGRVACRAASGASEQEAMRTAINAACALISGGVTDSGNCERQPPVSVKWLTED